MRPATQIVQGSQGGNRDAEPLTTPIYETTTFVFENAAEVRAYNEGRSPKFLYSRYGNPTIVAVEKTIAAVEGAESAMLFSRYTAAGQVALVNDSLGLLSVVDGRIQSVMSVTITDNRITGMYILADPDRLEHLEAPGED